MATRRETLQAQIDRAYDELGKLDAQPVEPDRDEVNLVWFEKSFGTYSRVYTYAAVKADDGLWYTTGPRSPKGYTWEELMDWLSQDGPFPVLWEVTDLEQIGG